MSKMEFIHLSLKSDWELIGIIREFFNNYFLHRIKDQEITYDIILIINELYENAVKYSSGGNTDLTISLDKNDVVNIEIKNKLKNKKINKNKLIESINKINLADAGSLYKEKFNSDTFWKKQKGNLGLIMIRERISGKIKLSFDDNNVIIKCKVALKG